MPISALRPLQRRGYARLWVAGFPSYLGTWMQVAALGIYAADTTGQVSWVGVIAAASFLATGLFSLWGGTLADRYERRLVFAWGTAGAALVSAGTAATFVWGSPSPLLLAGLAFALGALASVSGPAFNALIADLVPTEELPQANALTQVSWNLGRSIGPALAVAAMSIGSYTAVFVINAAFTLVEAAVGWTLPRERVASRSSTSAWRRLREGLSAVRAEPAFRLPLALGTAEMALVMPFIALVPAMAQLTLHGDGADTSRLFVAIGIGSAVGVLAVTTLVARLGQQRALIFSVMGAALCGVAYALSPSVPIAMALLVPLGALHTCAFAGAYALMQDVAPITLRGRAMSILMAATTIAYAVSSIALAGLADLVGLRFVLASACVACLLLVPVIWRTTDVRQAPVSPGL